MERKTFGDFFASSRGGADSRLFSQMAHLRSANHHCGCFLIVEVSDADWKRDGRPDDCMDFQSGIRTQLEVLQASERGDVDSSGFPRIRVLRVRSPSETAQIVRQLMEEALEHVAPAPGVLSAQSPQIRRRDIEANEQLVGLSSPPSTPSLGSQGNMAWWLVSISLD